jgi:Skp family chaperone for outer membrane proteins
MKLIALGAFVFATLSAGAASAQAQAQQPNINHGAPITGMCVYNPQYVIGASTAGQSLVAGMQRLEQEVTGELAPFETSLQSEYQQLRQGGQAADPDGARAQAWQQRRQEGQALSAQRRDELRYTQMVQTDAILNAARPIVIELYQSKGCAILIDASSAIAFNPAMDLTQDALQRLNTQLPALPAFNRLPVPAELQQPRQ